MSVSPPLPPPTPARGELPPVWTATISNSARGLCMAREKGWVLAWDGKNWLHLLGRTGQRQGQARTPADMTAATCADDGSAIVAGGSSGRCGGFHPTWHCGGSEQFPVGCWH